LWIIYSVLISNGLITLSKIVQQIKLTINEKDRLRLNRD